MKYLEFSNPSQEFPFIIVVFFSIYRTNNFFQKFEKKINVLWCFFYFFETDMKIYLKRFQYIFIKFKCVSTNAIFLKFIRFDFVLK